MEMQNVRGQVIDGALFLCVDDIVAMSAAVVNSLSPFAPMSERQAAEFIDRAFRDLRQKWHTENG